MTESLTTELSRIEGACVISRNTAFMFKGKPSDVKTIGRELNVRYVLEGSVRRAGNRMRVTVQLVDAENGSHLWANQFDRPVADFFQMQDEIVVRLSHQLYATLIVAEARRVGNRRTLTRSTYIFKAWLGSIKGKLRYACSRRAPFLPAPWRSSRTTCKR